MTPDPNRPEEEGPMAEIAHDVLNAVAAIRARAQLTRRRVGRVDDLSRDHIGADLAQIEAHAQRLTVLIDHLRAASEADAPRDRPRSRPCHD